MSYDFPNISDSEYEVMKVIWQKNPIKSNDIVDILNPSKQWNEKTIKTLVNRLLKKGIIDYKKDSKAYMYYPVIKKEDYKKMENQSFLQRVYNGSVNAMLTSFIKDTKLTQDEIKELKQLLEGDD